MIILKIENGIFDISGGGQIQFCANSSVYHTYLSSDLSCEKNKDEFCALEFQYLCSVYSCEDSNHVQSTKGQIHRNAK